MDMHQKELQMLLSNILVKKSNFALFLSFKDKTTFSTHASSDNALNDNFINVGNEKILKLPITPFKLDKKALKEPSKFEIKSLMNEVRYIYVFEADSKKYI